MTDSSDDKSIVPPAHIEFDDQQRPVDPKKIPSKPVDASFDQNVGDGKRTIRDLGMGETDATEATPVEKPKASRTLLLKGDKVGEKYELLESLGGGKSKDLWHAAVVGSGEHVFLKVLDDVTKPANSRIRDDGYLIEDQLFLDWEAHQRDVFDVLRNFSSGDGTLVLPIDQGKVNDGRNIYRVYPLITKNRKRRSSETTRAPNLRDLKTKKFKPEEKLRITQGLLLALWQLHRRGLVHGDIKPANVLQTDSPIGPVMRLIDFDNCYRTGKPFNAALLGGDDRYFSPEREMYQAGELEDLTALTVNSDCYSLALMLHELFSFKGELPKKLASGKIEYENLGFGSARLHSSLVKAMSENPRDRPTSHDLLVCADVHLKREEL